MNNEFFLLSLKTFQSTWGGNKTCADSDKTFNVVKLGNILRNRKYYLMNKKIISSNCFSDNDCSLNEGVECNIFEFVNGTNPLNLQAYVKRVNDTIFRVVNSFDNTRIFGKEYKIFSPDNTPLLYEHQCFTNESILIKNVHKTVLQDHDVSMRTPKTGKCGIFLIEYMPDKLKQIVQEVIPNVVNNTTSSILDFFSTTVTENTSLNYTNNYGIIDYNSTNSTDISSYDEQHTQDNTMLVHGLILASTVTFTASMTYLLTRMYNKYCKKAPIETADINIGDPNIMEINGKKAKIYYSDSSSNEPDYAIVDISSKKAKYTKSTYDTSNPSTSNSGDQERMELMSSTDDSTQDNVNINAYSLTSSSANKTDYVDISSKKDTDKKSTHDTSNHSTSHSHIYETIDMGYATDSSTHNKGNQYITYVNIDIDHKGAKIPRYDDCGPAYDYPKLPPRPVIAKSAESDDGIIVDHNDYTLLGLSEFPC